MPETHKRPVIKPKSAVRMMKGYANRKPDDEGVVQAGTKGNRGTHVDGKRAKGKRRSKSSGKY